MVTQTLTYEQTQRQLHVSSYLLYNADTVVTGDEMQ